MRCSACGTKINDEKPLSIIEATPEQWRAQCKAQDKHYDTACTYEKPEPARFVPTMGDGSIDYELMILNEQDERYEG